MRERHANGRRVSDRPVGAAARLWAKLTGRPVDTMAILGAGAACVIIVVNAIFLQAIPRPAPFLANPPAPTTKPELAALAPPRPPVASPGQQLQPVSVSGRRDDPIGDLIASSIVSPTRIAAVQRLLSEYGYGQIKPSGVVDDPTSVAIRKFESEHSLPVTGRLSARLLSELAAMIGHSIQ